MKRIFVTGGAGFIGSSFVRKAIAQGHSILNYDKLTYAADLAALESVENNERYRFLKGDICNGQALATAMHDFLPDAVVHFAAESHVDNSIQGPAEFINTNVTGTFEMLRACEPWVKKSGFRFIHVSTDEVYGDLEPHDPKFTTESRYKPSSPYAATKAASDHLLQAWFRTYGFPSIITHCSNNYGPWQNREKFIPTVVANALKGNEIPVYGRGENVRDWIHVDDHTDALWTVLEEGKIGETYNMGGNHEIRNIDLARQICEILDELKPQKHSYKEQIRFVTDRLGHDLRYAIDNSGIEKSLGWKPKISFKEGLFSTIQWYVRKYG